MKLTVLGLGYFRDEPKRLHVSQSIVDLVRVSEARSVLILVENLPVPFDRRVWQEACTLRDAGYVVSMICPTGKGFEKKFLLSLRVLFTRGFDVIHACNPPDLLFLIAGYVTFTGRVPDAELLAMLNTADVCVNPDRACALNDKSTMNKVMEYMALGKPVVQFDLTEGRRSAGEASLYANPDDAADLAGKIVELLDDPARRERMGRMARERVERELEWRHQAPGLLAAYAALRPRAAIVAPVPGA